MALALVLAVSAVTAVAWFQWWLERRPMPPCPYTGKPLRRAEDLGYFYRLQVLRFLSYHRSAFNPLMRFDKACFCRDTGRLFPDTIAWWGGAKLDWSFISKRFPGTYVSWGSLTNKQQEIVRQAHTSIEGFQTAFSSGKSAPSAVEEEYAYTKPGPLYVNIETYSLVGWKCVPETELEVLIVQQPAGRFESLPVSFTSGKLHEK